MKVSKPKFACYIVITILLSPLILPVMVRTVYCESAIRVGLYYYLWYRGNWTENHKNCRDRPILGEYNSQNVSVISQHMEWFEELNIDFLIISWWGNSSFSERDDAEFIDVATQRVFSTVKKKEYGLELAILVEPFNTSSGQYNFTTIYNYVNHTYVGPYSDIYMKLHDRPLLLFYNEDVNLTKGGQIPLDNGFEVRISGHQSYANWIYWSVDIERWGEGRADYLGQTEQKLCMDREINIMPRYDDEHFRPDGAVPNPIDQDYSGYLYDEQWNRVLGLASQGKVKIVTITSWNEYPERTMIEPSIDDTSAYEDNPYFLFSKTKRYILTLKRLEKYDDLQEQINSLWAEINNMQDQIDALQEDVLTQLSNLQNLMYIFIATTVILIATTVYFAIRKPKIKP